MHFMRPAKKNSQEPALHIVWRVKSRTASSNFTPFPLSHNTMFLDSLAASRKRDNSILRNSTGGKKHIHHETSRHHNGNIWDHFLYCLACLITHRIQPIQATHLAFIRFHDGIIPFPRPSSAPLSPLFSKHITDDNTTKNYTACPTEPNLLSSSLE